MRCGCFSLALIGLLVLGAERARADCWFPVSAQLPFFRHSWRTVTHPPGQVDPRIDPKLRRAATIAEQRSGAHTKARCWQYVKQALLAAGAINSYPQTAYATQAGDELCRKYGFSKLSVRDPYAAPIGAVLVYGGRGHVEIRTRDGFASDYHSKNRCFYPLLAAYGKFSSEKSAPPRIASR